MQYANVHLRTVSFIHISVVELSEHFEAFDDFSKNGVLAIKRTQMSFGQRDEEVAIVEIGAGVSRDHEADIIDLGLQIDFVLEVGHVLLTLCPDRGRILAFYPGHVIYIVLPVLFCTYSNSALL